MRIKELDSLRGIAAIMVVFFHFTYNKPEAQYGFKIGTTGVDLFFIISGFVIFMSLNNISSSRDFIINRISRLYPTYWASVTFTFLILLVCSKFTGFLIQFPIYLKNMTMFQYYLKAPNLDEVYWTMIVEMLFYLGVLIIFQLKLLRYFKLIGLILTLIAFMMKYYFSKQGIVVILVGLIPLIEYVPLFFAGTIFYKIYSKNGNSYINYGLILICFICQNLLFKNSGRARYYITQFDYLLILLIYYSLFIAFINNYLSFLVSKVTIFLGKISFALYLTHNIVSTAILLPFFLSNFKINFWLACLITLTLNLLVAAFITYKIEIPYSKLLKEKLRSLVK